MTEDVDVAALRILDDVCELDGPARMARLSEACAGDPNLFQRVESLLIGMAKNDAFLQEPTIGDATLSVTSTVAGGPGTRIGPYKLLELIGQGGMGSVFMAEQLVPVRRRVALKIIKLGMDTRQTL